MRIMSMHRPVKIAPGYSAKDWQALALDPHVPGTADWQRAIAIFEARMRRRFFEPADALIRAEEGKSEKTFGFAVLAVDCLVIETLQGFRAGIINHNGQSKRLFTDFLKGWQAFQACLPDQADASTLADRVYADCRCALLHSGATDGELRVGVTGPTFKFGDGHVRSINRTQLHKCLRKEFDAYIHLLKTQGANLLRKNFKTKMDAICGQQQSKDDEGRGTENVSIV